MASSASSFLRTSGSSTTSIATAATHSAAPLISGLLNGTLGPTNDMIPSW